MPRPQASAHFDRCCHSQLSVGRQFRVTWEGVGEEGAEEKGGLRRVTLARHFASQVKLVILLLASLAARPRPPHPRELTQVGNCESNFCVTPAASPALCIATPPAYCNYRCRLLLKATCGSRVIHQHCGAWGKWQLERNERSSNNSTSNNSMRWYFSCFLANFYSNTGCLE